MNLCEAFKALGDDTRLRILGLLSGRELCVCQICLTLGIPQPNASKHLKCLRFAGLISCRRRSQWCFYRFSDAFTQELGEVYTFLCERWRTDAPYVQDTEKLLLLLRTRRCCGEDLLCDTE